MLIFSKKVKLLDLGHFEEAHSDRPKAQFLFLFGWVLPIFLFFAIWMFLVKRMQKSMGGGSGGILGIGSSKKMINSEKPNVKFDDTAGI